MTGDLLGAAARALRETGASAPRGDETLARVLRDVRQARRRGHALGVVALSFGLVLTGVGAWAATTGRLAGVARRVRHATPPATGAGALERAAAVPRGPEIVPLERAPAPATVPPPGVPEPARRVALLARPAAERAGHMAPPAGPAADVTPQSPDELYREAHEAHFARHDFQAALALWDRYLALTPLPGLAVEARYNRAIALFRLGRRAETRQALRPFADGDYGSYRAAEARALLDALAR